MAKYQGSDPGLPDKRAGYLIDWEMMVAGCAGGYHTLDLGRSDPGADGLRLYKSSWGAKEEPLTYTHVSRTRAARRPRLRRRRALPRGHPPLAGLGLPGARRGALPLGGLRARPSASPSHRARVQAATSLGRARH